MQETKIKKTDPNKRHRRVLSASTLAGDSVKSSAGDDLGKEDEIMIDVPSGRVTYAVLSFGGFATPYREDYPRKKRCAAEVEC